MSNQELSKGMLTKKDLSYIAIRSFYLQNTFNFSRMQGIGFLFTIIPALRKFYPNKEELGKAMLRHTDFFNTSPLIASPIIGIVLAMEEQRENPDTIRAFKVATMGPIAGVGDAMFNFMYEPVLKGIIGSIAMTGSWIALPFAIIVSNLPKVFAFAPLIKVYELGSRALLQIQSRMKQINRFAQTVGLMALGGLTASYIRVNVISEFSVNEQKFNFQTDLFDKLMPNFLSLALLLLCFYLIRSKKWNIQMVIWSVILVALAGSFFKILG